MTIALRAENVIKIYGSGTDSVTAVDDVSFDVLEGEFVALVGPSGSGKTSMLAMLAGLLKPTHGKVLIEGHEMSRMGDRQRTKFRRQAIGFLSGLLTLPDRPFRRPLLPPPADQSVAAPGISRR